MGVIMGVVQCSENEMYKVSLFMGGVMLTSIVWMRTATVLALALATLFSIYSVLVPHAYRSVAA